MKPFKDFIQSETSNTLPLVVNQVNAGVTKVLSSEFVSILNDDATDKFSAEVSKTITSPEFISNLSDKIGSPTESETEDEFVERAKATMRELLKSKLKV